MIPVMGWRMGRRSRSEQWAEVSRPRLERQTVRNAPEFAKDSDELSERVGGGSSEFTSDEGGGACRPKNRALAQADSRRATHASSPGLLLTETTLPPLTNTSAGKGLALYSLAMVKA